MAQKICCGGFNLGEGLELDGRTLKATGSGGMVVTANLSFYAGGAEVVADKTYEEVLEYLMSGENVVVRAIYEDDDRICLMSFLGAKDDEITFVDNEGIKLVVNEDGWYAIPLV